ncbi:Apoptosis-inducing factor 1, mitochondrial [Intoshia linei]|uniref:Apoptosis-inducing factor 1, mitochondrial n=1 Tax=Intoshia linei TaxID=1819745 RepID=A0A177AXU7_9BILA|nr:Apoptosis-inducing factor 1, mitochondrial [Intoshia linei]
MSACLRLVRFQKIKNNLFGMSNGMYPQKHNYNQTFNRYYINSISSTRTKSWWKSKCLLGVAMGVGSVSFGLFTIYYSLSKNKQSNPSKYTIKSEHLKIKSMDLTKQPEILTNVTKCPYIVVGSGAAGFGAALGIRANDPLSKVLILTENQHYPYKNPPLSKYLWNNDKETLTDKFLYGVSDKFDDKNRSSVFYEDEEYFLPFNDLLNAEYGGISCMRNSKVTHLDVDNKCITYIDRDDNKHVISYDKCVLATGLEALKDKPWMSSLDSNFLSFCRNLSEWKIAFDKSADGNTIALVGKGLLIAELANSIRFKGKDMNVNVLVINESEYLLDDLLPKYLARQVTKLIKIAGVNMILSQKIDNAKIIDNDKVILTTNNGKEYTVNHIVADYGSVQNKEYIKTCSTFADKMDSKNRLKTDQFFKVTDSIWGAGVLCSYWNLSCNKYINDSTFDHAFMSGRLAGRNCAVNADNTNNSESKNASQSYIPYKYITHFSVDLGLSHFCGIGRIDSKLKTRAYFTDTENSNMFETDSIMTDAQEEEFLKRMSRGVVFYINENEEICGILSWNMYKDLDQAKLIISQKTSSKECDEIARIFSPFKVEEYERDNVEEPKTEQTDSNSKEHIESSV